MTTYGDLRRKDSTMEGLVKRDFPEHAGTLESVLAMQHDLKEDVDNIVAINYFKPSEAMTCNWQVLFSLKSVYDRTVDLLWNAHYSVLNNHTVDALPQFRTIVEHTVAQYALCLCPEYAMKTLEQSNRPANRNRHRRIPFSSWGGGKGAGKSPANRNRHRRIPFGNFKDKLYEGTSHEVLSKYYGYLSRGGIHPDPMIFSPSDKLSAHYNLHQIIALSMFAATSCPGSIDLLIGSVSKGTKTKVQSIVDKCSPYLPMTCSLHPNKRPFSDRLAWKPSRPAHSAPESCHRAENSGPWR